MCWLRPSKLRHEEVSQHDIIVIGASAGGLTPLKALVAALPEDLTATLFVVVHVGPYKSILPEILNYSSRLLACHPRQGEPIERGRIYVAPPDHHMLIGRGFIRLSRGPRENRARPAVDPTFRSAARVYGPRVIGVVLSGMLSDGTAGVAEIKRLGGLAIVQDPADAEYSGMPSSALAHAGVDYAVPAAELGGLISALVGRPRHVPPPKKTPTPQKIPHPAEAQAMSGEYSLKPPPLLICPECGGAVQEMDVDTLPFYRCHIGHSFSPADMEAAQFKEMERAMEKSLRTIVERRSLCVRLSQAASEMGRTASAEQWEAAAAQAEERAESLRDFLGQSWLRPMPDDDLPVTPSGRMQIE